jgi:hypothetical protein
VKKRVAQLVQKQQQQRKGQLDAALQQQKAQQAQMQAAAAAANGGVARPPNAQAGPSQLSQAGQSPRVGIAQPQINGQQIQMNPQVSLPLLHFPCRARGLTSR